MTDDTYTPNPDLVQRLAAKVINDGIDEIRSTGFPSIALICRDDFLVMSQAHRDILAEAVSDQIELAEIGYALRGAGEVAGA